MYALSFYVPLEHAEVVKNALFNVGAGRIGEYSHCAWQTQGEGQFMPHDSATPFLGKANQLEKIQEIKVEMVCDAIYIQAAIAALKASHPYETPAYHVIRLEHF
ncbi:MAG: NGG1p interacting factor NIF3 [Gammaproteobacteria bacterium]|nr:NGG1p interacting factor NIF3 [Gammaproteobacteria bacterium]